MKTMPVVQWTQRVDTHSTRIRYRFENERWMETPMIDRKAGIYETVLLGVPENSRVTFFFKAEVEAGNPNNGVDDQGNGALFSPWESEQFTFTSGALPSIIPRPTVSVFDPQLASGDRYLLGSVEDTADPDRYYAGPFWIYIMDRAGRIVWYYRDFASNPCMAYPRLSRDQTHLYIEKRSFFNEAGYQPKILRMTLDYRHQETMDIPGLDDCMDITTDGGILFNTHSSDDGSFLKERRPDGTIREIWSCDRWAIIHGLILTENFCYSNTVSWIPQKDSVLLSFPYVSTVVEIDRSSGELVHQWGSALDSCSFEPETSGFEFNHFPTWTPEHTLLVSTHQPGHKDKKCVGKHRFVEYSMDDTENALSVRWEYDNDDGQWPMYKGEAVRLDNGNTLINYGTGGVIKEVTPEKTVVWSVKWDADFSDDHFNKMVGHMILLDDLYALTRGWLSDAPQ